jgi:hypothetical protein
VRPAARQLRRIEFGDYQTPPELAQACCALLARLGVRPASVLEPTCGTGAFLQAALTAFPQMRQAMGLEIDPAYARQAAAGVNPTGGAAVTIREGDFFALDWQAVLTALADPLLVIGNPPWVTNSVLGQLGGANLPEKSNYQQRSGLDALTGKSNFDISEWMLARLCERLHGRTAVLAMLCKTAVARKVLQQAWKNGLHVGDAQLFPIDARKHFGAAVDACFLVCPFAPWAASRECRVAAAWDGGVDVVIGYRDGQLVADVAAYERCRPLRGASARQWRSGVKHDCSPVMELRGQPDRLTNGLGEVVCIEETCLYPMRKSSEVAGGAQAPPRWMLVPQRKVGEDTSALRTAAPRTWAYLQAHRNYLNARASKIYAHRPPFSIFGVGDYSFAPWKVAISGFYKRLEFRVIGPAAGKPTMLDDTAYFLPCDSRREARRLVALLNSETARGFFRALVFWDAKRPITVSLLSQLSLERLAASLAGEDYEPTGVDAGRKPLYTLSGLAARGGADSSDTVRR